MGRLSRFVCDRCWENQLGPKKAPYIRLRENAAAPNNNLPGLM